MAKRWVAKKCFRSARLFLPAPFANWFELFWVSKSRIAALQLWRFAGQGSIGRAPLRRRRFFGAKGVRLLTDASGHSQIRALPARDPKSAAAQRSPTDQTPFDSKLGSWEAGSMKTTLDLPDELIREVKLRAVVQRRTVKDLVADFIRQGLGMAPGGQAPKRPASSRVQVGDNGLPVIRCAPNAPATRMSVEELIALDQETQTEEDWQRAGISL